MTKEFLNKILESKKNDGNKQSGYCLIEAISTKSDEKFMNFYAVPSKMKETVLEDPSLLTQSADAKSIYKIGLNDYNSNPEAHNSTAEDEFTRFQQYHDNTLQR
jgi:hypothetical protein